MDINQNRGNLFVTWGNKYERSYFQDQFLKLEGQMFRLDFDNEGNLFFINASQGGADASH